MEIKKCPFCGKNVLAIAKVCKHCGQSFDKPKLQKEIEKSSDGGIGGLTEGFSDDCDIVYERYENLPKDDLIEEPQAPRRVQTPPSLSRKRQKMFSAPFSSIGRIRRLEYVLSFVVNFLFITALTYILGRTIMAIIGLGVGIASAWFLLAQGAKRCHDLDHSGWCQLIPFYILWMIFAEGTSGRNSFGDSPK